MVKKSDTKQAQASAILDGVAATLPAMLRSQILQERAASVGFDCLGVQPMLAKIEEELAELREQLQADTVVQKQVEEELGDLIFACINLARQQKFDAEAMLQKTNQKFIRRFEHIENSLQATGRRVHDATLSEMEELWQAAKALE